MRRNQSFCILPVLMMIDGKCSGHVAVFVTLAGLLVQCTRRD